MVNEARYLAWNCESKTRLSYIVLHLHIHNNYRKIVTQQMQKKQNFENVILKCFQNHCRLLKSQKQTKAFFQSEPEVLTCFELNYRFLQRHKKPLSLATTRKQQNPVNTA